VLRAAQGRWLAFTFTYSIPIGKSPSTSLHDGR
jgi:hypothetical protein